MSFSHKFSVGSRSMEVIEKKKFPEDNVNEFYAIFFSNV